MLMCNQGELGMCGLVIRELGFEFCTETSCCWSRVRGHVFELWVLKNCTARNARRDIGDRCPKPQPYSCHVCRQIQICLHIDTYTFAELDRSAATLPSWASLLLTSLLSLGSSPDFLGFVLTRGVCRP